MKGVVMDVVVDLIALDRELTEGNFYDDYDESWRLVGKLREGIVELERLRGERRVLQDEVLKLRTYLMSAPYCCGCGQANLLAPAEVRQRLQDQGVQACMPSDCPNWSVEAQYDHASQEWVPLSDLNDLPEAEEPRDG